MPDPIKSTANLITPILRLSYCSLFSPRLGKDAKPGDRARYETNGLILPKAQMTAEDQTRLDAMLLAGIEVGRNSELGKDKFDAFLREGKIKVLRTDVESSGHPPEFKMFFRAWTYGIGSKAAVAGQPSVVGQPPGIVSQYKDPITGKPMAVTDPNKVYSGCWARLSVRPFYSNFEKKNPAISWQLVNVQIMAKPPEGFTAERLDGKVDATDEFDATEEMAQADLAAMHSSSYGTNSNASDADELAKLLGG